VLRRCIEICQCTLIGRLVETAMSARGAANTASRCQSARTRAEVLARIVLRHAGVVYARQAGIEEPAGVCRRRLGLWRAFALPASRPRTWADAMSGSKSDSVRDDAHCKSRYFRHDRYVQKASSHDLDSFIAE
jgi:hypothetical protein